jgi:hypothetical protein
MCFAALFVSTVFDVPSFGLDAAPGSLERAAHFYHTCAMQEVFRRRFIRTKASLHAGFRIEIRS